MLLSSIQEYCNAKYEVILISCHTTLNVIGPVPGSLTGASPTQSKIMPKLVRWLHLQIMCSVSKKIHIYAVKITLIISGGDHCLPYVATILQEVHYYMYLSKGSSDSRHLNLKQGCNLQQTRCVLSRSRIRTLVAQEQSCSHQFPASIRRSWRMLQTKLVLSHSRLHPQVVREQVCSHEFLQHKERLEPTVDQCCFFLFQSTHTAGYGTMLQPSVYNKHKERLQNSLVSRPPNQSDEKVCIHSTLDKTRQSRLKKRKRQLVQMKFIFANTSQQDQITCAHKVG